MMDRMNSMKSLSSLVSIPILEVVDEYYGDTKVKCPAPASDASKRTSVQRNTPFPLDIPLIKAVKSLGDEDKARI